MILANYTHEAQKILLACQDLAQQKRHIKIEPEHLALCLIESKEIRELIDKKKIDFNSLSKEILHLVDELPKSFDDREPIFSTRFIQLISAVNAYAVLKNLQEIKPQDIFLCIISNRSKFGSLGGIFAKYFLSNESGNKSTTKNIRQSSDLLDKYCENINELIKLQKIEPVFARDNEIQRLIQILSRKNRNNPLLIGQSGVGRSSIVYGLVNQIIKEKVPSYLMTKEILSLDLNLILSGTTLRGQFEERMNEIFASLLNESGRYILFIRDLSLFMGAGGQGASDAINMLKSQMQKGNVQIVALTTEENYQKYIEKDPSLERLFQPMWIEQPSESDAKIILKGIKERLEEYHGVFILDEAIDAAYELSARLLGSGVMPQSAIDVLDEACAKHRIVMDEKPQELVKLEEKIQSKKSHSLSLKKNLEQKTTQYKNEIELIESIRALKKEYLLSKEAKIKNALDLKEKEFYKKAKTKLMVDPFVSRQDIATVIALQTGIPAQKMLQSEREKLANMQTELSLKVIGQKEAVDAVSLAIQRSRVGIKYGKKPIGSFLFLGSTGVGKTELAKNLALFLFDNPNALVRFDMSEFMEKQSVARLIGAPPGYQGFEEGGELTGKVKRNPYSVVLFDEIEKAHPDVLNILLQVLDEARLTDTKGNTVDFTNTILIMTSNIGAEILLERKNGEFKILILEELKKYLRPEFINRIDEIVYFNPLSKQNIADIASLLINNLINVLKKENFFLSVDEKLFNEIVKQGYDPFFGARPLKRALTKLLENPLASAILNQEVTEGKNFLISIDKNQKIIFSPNAFKFSPKDKIFSGSNK